LLKERVLKKMKVKLTYFKPSGKYYGEFEDYETEATEFYAAVNEIKDLLNTGENPGYAWDMVREEGFSALIEITIDDKGNTLPHLITYASF
jgi:hypothetical protein